MADTIYILFPRNLQPTEGEVRALEQCLHAIGTPRYGINKRSGALAIELDGARFRASRDTVFEVDALVSAWEKQGCTVSDACPFAPNELALQPKPEDHRKPLQMPELEKSADPTTLRAREAVAMSRLETDRVASGIRQGGEAVRQIVPFLGVVLLLGCVGYAGYALYQAAQNIDVETRRETIKRVDKKPMKEKLTPNKRQPAP